MYNFSKYLMSGIVLSFFLMKPKIALANHLEFKLELTQIGTDYAELNLRLPELMREVEIYRSSDNIHFNKVKAFGDSKDHYMLIDPFDQNMLSIVFYKIVCVNLKGESFAQKFSFTIDKNSCQFSLHGKLLTIQKDHSKKQSHILFYIFNDNNNLIYEGTFHHEYCITLPMEKQSNEVWYIYYNSAHGSGVQRMTNNSK